MKRLGLLAGLCVMVIASATPKKQADPQTFSVSGDLPKPVTLSVTDLDKLPQQTATVQEQDGTTTKYSGVLLRAILENAGAPTGNSLRGKALASYILASARDGYQVVFTLAELEPAFGNEQILVVDKVGNKPLFGYQGPFRILCPADKAGARSLRMLSTIQFVSLRK
jgi:Oxidoreductase molybdopterin binding domain